MKTKSSMFAHYCEKCGKEIYPTYGWTYKKNGKYYCSWKCYRADEHLKPKREIIRPKVGDTIRIKLVSGIQDYTDKEGVVQFYDCFGQMHGTWGKLVIIPGEDIFEIIGGNDDE